MTGDRWAIRRVRQAVAGALLWAGLLTAGGLAIGLLTVRPAQAAVEANTATAEQLDRIRGIGPAIAARIVAERAKGPYRDMADLQQRVRGIGPATAAKLAADGLTVNGTGAARAPGRPPPSREVAGSAERGPVAGASVTPVARTPVGRGTVTDARVEASDRIGAAAQPGSTAPARSGVGASAQRRPGTTADRPGAAR